MERPARHVVQHSQRQPTRAGWLLAIPPLVAFVLAVPCLNISYMSDDFTFLERAASFSAAQLLPNPTSAFYRPIPRELYFAFLTLLSPNNPIWGHLINALLLAGAVLLTTMFARRIGGERLGILSGLFLASLGAMPCLVAWVSCSQDLFAMVFLGAALNLELAGRRGLSMACFGAALLSKETALFFLPAIVLTRALASSKQGEAWRAAIPYSALVIVWGAIHPKIRAFMLHGPATGSGGYVGVDNPFMFRNALRTLGTLVNIPPTGLKTPWPVELTICLLASFVLLALLFQVKMQKANVMHQALLDRRVLWIAILLGALPAVLTIASAKHWFPYYSCIPAIGTSILLALALQRYPWRTAVVAVAAFAILGVWYRGTDVGKISLPAEANFRRVSNCLKKIESGFRKLHPQFPDSARIYVSVQTSTLTSIHVHLINAQALRTYYLNKTLVTMPAEYQDGSPWPRFLFWVAPSCEVFEISLPEMRTTSTKAQPDYAAYQKTLRSYAMGAWAAGDTDKAIGVLLSMPERDQVSWDFDRRLAAALLLTSGRVAEARKALAGFPKPGRGQALDGVSAVLSPELPRPGLDDAAFLVFGLRLDDAEAFRYLMFYFSDAFKLQKTKRMAERLLALRPGDDEAIAMLKALKEVPEWEGVLVPPETWQPLFQQAY